MKKKKTIKSIKKELCRFGYDHSVIEPHECPYESDVHDNNDQEYCMCCSKCIDACADEI